MGKKNILGFRFFVSLSLKPSDRFPFTPITSPYRSKTTRWLSESIERLYATLISAGKKKELMKVHLSFDINGTW